MKKIVFTFAILITQILSAQDFPGNDVKLLDNKELKLLEKSANLQEYGYDGFYVNPDLKKKYKCCDSYNSKYSSLAGKVFKVLSYESYTKSTGTQKYKLKIENEETGIIYYDYNPKFKHSFPFKVIGGLTFPEGHHCKDITNEADKFTGEKRSMTKMAEGIHFLKTVKDSSTSLYMGIRQGGTTPNVAKKGLILLLENDKRINRPEAKISVKTNTARSSMKYIYSAFIELTDAETKLLLDNKITDVRLYIYDGTVEAKGGQILIEYLKCLTK